MPIEARELLVEIIVLASPKAHDRLQDAQRRTQRVIGFVQQTHIPLKRDGAPAHFDILCAQCA